MMRKNISKWVFFLLLPLIFGACSTVKNVKIGNDEKKEKAPVNEKLSEIEEQKQKGFEYLFVEALKEKALGNLQKAIQLLSGCLELDPNSSAAMYELATIHAGNNDLTSASLLLEKAITITPENKWYKLLLARIYQKSKKYDQAADIYTELLDNDPENLEYLFMKAALLANAGQVDLAVDAYNKLEEKVGVNEQISVAKQKLFVQDNKIEKAYSEIEKLIESAPEEPKYYGLMADLYLSREDTISAFKYYKKIQEIDPDNGFVHFSLANFYLQTGNLKQSFKETKKGFRSKEVDIQTKLQLYMVIAANPAQTGIKPGQDKELIDILKAVHPDEYLVYTVSAENYLKLGNLERARVEFLKAIEIEKNDYILWERLLLIDNDLQDWKKLKEHANNVNELFPKQPQGYFFNAIACIQMEEYNETVNVVDRGLIYIDENKALKAQFLMLKGEALYKLNLKDEAFSLFDQSVELDPDNYVALNNYAYYLSITGENLDKAERMSGKVIERFPDNPTYLDTYAWVLFKKGEFKLARFYMKSAIQNSKEESATLLEHYGDILFKLQQKEEAMKYWEKAKKMGGASDLLDRKISEQNYINE